MELWQQAWTPEVRAKDRGDKQPFILLPRQVLSVRSVVALCGLGEEMFHHRCLCIPLRVLPGVSQKEVQEQVSDFSLLLLCSGWDVRTIAITTVGVQHLCGRPVKNKLLVVNECGSFSSGVTFSHLEGNWYFSKLKASRLFLQRCSRMLC